MNRIEELIEKFCPDGVQFKELGECALIKRGRRVTKEELSPEKKYPVYSGGVAPMGYFEKHNQPANTITVVKYGTAGFVNFISEVFWANDVCYCIEPCELLDNKFLFYFLKSQQEIIQSQATNAIPAHLPTEVINSIQIPLPPLLIQQEIVNILDKFTQLEAELEAELEARTRQYEYYRNDLLNFEGKEVVWKTLGEIGKVCMCKRVMKHETKIVGDIPFYKIGTFGKIADAYISNELYEDYKKRFSSPKIGEILISAAGTIGRTVIYSGEPAYFQDSNIVWISNNERMVTNKFLFYYYKIVEWKTDGGTISRLYNDNLSKAKIPIPPLPEQERIVAILDKFDALVNDISLGLPAEIAARRKQYEYYREKLLDFKSLTN